MFTSRQTLEKAKQQLNLFITHPDNFIRLIQPLISVLDHFNEARDEDIIALRNEIHLWIKDNSLEVKRTVNGTSLHEALHGFLIAMAASHPLNSLDPITQESIDPSKRIVTSDGYQFDAESLLTWIKIKGKMINPLTNLIFSEKDQQGIRLYAAEKGLNLTPHHVAPPPEDPGLLRSALAAMGATRNALTIETSEILGESIRRLGDDYLAHDTDSHRPPFSFFSNRADEIRSRNTRFMRATAEALASYGLTFEFLRENWYGDENNVFGEFEDGVLIYLISGTHPRNHIYHCQLLTGEQRLSPALAIAEISGLHMYELDALRDNFALGLRRNHLLTWRERSNAIRFGHGHEVLLRELMSAHHLSSTDAIHRISGLTEEQAWDSLREIHTIVQRRV